MKSLVLFLLLQVVLSLAQVGKHHNGRWVPWLPPNHNIQACHNRGFAPNTWPKVAMHQIFLPGPSSGNVGWRHNQGVDNWMNPFQSIFFGYPNFFSPWGFQPQYQSGMLSRYPRRPLPMAPHFSSIQGQWPMTPHLGPTHGQWAGHMGPTNKQWPMFQHFQHIGPTHGPWPMHPHMSPHIPPYYFGERNNYYAK